MNNNTDRHARPCHGDPWLTLGHGTLYSSGRRVRLGVGGGGGGGGVYSSRYSSDTVEGPRAPAVKLTARHSSLKRVRAAPVGINKTNSKQHGDTASGPGLRVVVASHSTRPLSSLPRMCSFHIGPAVGPNKQQRPSSFDHIRGFRVGWSLRLSYLSRPVCQHSGSGAVCSPKMQWGFPVRSCGSVYNKPVKTAHTSTFDHVFFAALSSTCLESFT